MTDEPVTLRIDTLIDGGGEPCPTKDAPDSLGGSPQALLGVERSATARRWVRGLDAAGERVAMALAQRYGLSEVVARVLAGRGVSVANADRELDPTLRELLPDPSTLTDFDALVARLADAVERCEAIAIFADYDVDGATSAAVVARTLRQLGVSPTITIPDRLTEGYGPSVGAMRRLRDAGAEVVLMLDCGSGALEPVRTAAALGMATLVVDHHPVDALAPADAVVNPNRHDDLSGVGALAAVGVVFVVMVGLVRELRARGHFRTRREPSLMHLADCVALGTVADVVPLTALNRAFVRRGLEVIARRTNAGLAALGEAAAIRGPVGAYHLGYVLGPRINAGGRIGEANLGARLLTTDSPEEAAPLADELDRLNRERRALEREALCEAEALADPSAPVTVIAGRWHKGVVGLIAARLKERYRRPAVALALDGAEATGSARSVTGVDIGAAVRAAAAEGVIARGGGHAMAAGLTLEASSIGALTEFLNARLEGDVARALANDRLAIDGVVALSAIDEPFARTLAGHGPWGAGRRKPVFVLEGAFVERVVPVGGEALRLSLRALCGSRGDAMLFRANGTLGETLRQSEGAVVHLAVEVSHGAFRGVPRAEIVVVDAAPMANVMRSAA